jgi:arylsulfatase A-like enzyme
MTPPLQNDSRQKRWLACLGWAFAVSLALACGLEWEHYRRLFSWQRMGLNGWQRWVLIWTLWAKTLALFVPWIALAALAVRWRGKLGKIVLTVSATLLLAWSVFDLRTEEITGNHLTTYLAQADWSSIQFAGNMGAIGWYVAVRLILIGAFVFVGLEIANALVRQRYWPAHPALAIGLYTAAMAGVIPAWQGLKNPEVLEQLHGALPVSFAWLGLPRHVGMRTRAFSFPFERTVNASFARSGEILQTAVPADERELLPRESRPNIVFVLIESLRADALNPTWMPKLDTWSRRGVRFSNHYAGGNCSPTGLFELLYGRSCLAYSLTLNAHILPQSCTTFHRCGYRATYLSTLDDTTRLRGGDFLNRRAFDRVSVSHQTDWNEGDRWTISAAQRTLHEASGQAQFVVLFLGGTHHPYPSPAGARRFTPVLPDGWSILDPDLPKHLVEMRNTYANSVAFMDEQVSAFLGSLDLDHTIVVVTADHGESLFDDGTASHSSRFSPVQTQVPMFLLGPGIPAGSIDTPSTNADILPTVLHAAVGKPVTVTGVSGIDLLDGATREQRSSILLGGFQFGEPFDVALVRPDGWLSLGVSVSTTKVEAYGFLNDRGEIDPACQQPTERVPTWTQAFAEQIERIVPGARTENEPFRQARE